MLLPTYNRAEALRTVWESYTSDPVVQKIVVVDDGSTDETPSLLPVLAASSPVIVQIIRHPRRLGQPQARRTALSAPHGEWIMFGEDDVYLSPGYISTLLEQAENLGADVVAGRLVPIWIDGQFVPELLNADAYTPMAWTTGVIDLSLLEADFGIKTEGPLQVPYVHTVALIRDVVLQEVQFDTRYRGNAAREETDFYLTADRKGFRIFFTPDAVCFHLRGQFSSRGGQRMSRLAVEYWNFVNTWYTVRKHWDFLTVAYGFKGNVSRWMLSYFCRRQRRQLRRLFDKLFSRG